MNYKNFSSLTQPKSQVGAVVGLFGVLIGICSALYPTTALAETNLNGDVIEVIESTNSSYTADPIRTFIDEKQAVENQNPDDLWARIKEGYAMDNLQSTYTANHEAWYAARPDYVKNMVARSQKYLFHIVEEVQKRGMPTEIALLPMVESAFNPKAYSRSHAAGLWQFVPATGKNFGLKQNWWVDNRRDVTAATKAALDYLEKLHGMFGTWELALAAYNAGEGTVQRAIERNQRKGLPTDYQSLSLPEETRNYVPKLQAIKNIISDPERYGLTINSIPNQPYFAHVNAPKQIDAKLAASLAEITYDEFIALNPSYNRPVITSNGEAQHDILLPTWAADNFTTNLENYNKPLSSWQTYHARRGERMDSIARKFGLHVSELRDVNGLSDSKRMRSSQPVLVPINYTRQSSPDDGATNISVSSMENLDKVHDADAKHTSSKIKTHRVKRGETLQVLAKKYDTDEKTLLKLNKLNSNKLKAGQVVKVDDATDTTEPPMSRGCHHTVSKASTGSKHVGSHTGHIQARSHIRLR
jgi:membrane-bound lytic murein transglycosylase D